MKYYLQTALLLSFFIGSNVWADEDHERARELVKSGEIIALEQLLQKIVAGEKGKLRLLEAELEKKSGRLVYELELVDEKGLVRELLFDAKTGEALRDEDD
ncbi:MAG: PepSY domain-containing protein [Gammaproteobacteria bacterium]|nr:PepSY domain-containing protein [Gammaproteobacteria bacterium]